MVCHPVEQPWAYPVSAWSQLALQTGEMLLASRQVIGYRIGRMAAGDVLNVHDHSEFALMGQEKIDAAAESAQAMTARMFDVYLKMGTLVFEQILTRTCSMMPDNRNSFVAMDTWPEKIMTDMAGMANHSSQAIAQLSDAAASVMQDGLQPIHARATENARRLSEFNGIQHA
jgi:hypothetical protein